MVKPLTKAEIQLVRQFRVNEVSRQIFQPIENTTGTSFECLKTKSIACSLKSDSALSIEANTTSIIMRGKTLATNKRTSWSPTSFLGSVVSPPQGPETLRLLWFSVGSLNFIEGRKKNLRNQGNLVPRPHFSA